MFAPVPSLLLPSFVLLASLIAQEAAAAEPPVISPFGRAAAVRRDALPGYVEMSHGEIIPGHVYLTRDARLKLHDEKVQRQREVPLRAVRQIQCAVKKEWMERQWRFKELTRAEKVYTGRSYPARQYVHTITLHDGRTLSGGLSAVVYVRPCSHAPSESGKYNTPPQPRRCILHKRDKGKIGEKLESLHYVKLIKLGEAALAEGRKKAAAQNSN